MSIVSAKEMLLSASENGYAVGAFNVTNIIQMQGVIQAAINKNAPLIIQTSMSPAKSIGVEVFGAVYRIFANDAPVPICLHLDHCTDVELCKRAAKAGYTNKGLFPVGYSPCQLTFMYVVRVARSGQGIL